jgi:hypothetical protein
MIEGVTASQLAAQTGVTPNDSCSVNSVYHVRDQSPIVIRIDDGDICLTAPEVLFDLAGTGRPQLLGWTRAGVDEGFLVLDRDGDGMITSGREMFGNFTPLSWTLGGILADNGFDALRWFDELPQGGDADGWITSQDAVFSRLGLWVDSNHNGVTDAGELRTLGAC